LKKILKKLIVLFYKIMAAVLPVSRKTVLFMSNMGKNYSGNPKAIYLAMKKDERFKDCRLVWAFTRAYLSSGKGTGAGMPADAKGCPLAESGINLQNSIDGIDYVVYGGFKYYYRLATAGIWVFDTRQEPYLVKRKKNIYLQTWHGTPLKKLGLDISEMNMAGEGEKNSKVEHYRKAFTDESAKWDYLIAQNDFSAETFRRCFGYKREILMTGYPRNDELFGAVADNEKKVLLYAPTWRDDKYLEGGWYRYSSELDFEKLEKELGDRFRIIVKLHYLVKLRKNDIPEECIKSGFVSVIGNECDIAELYKTADGLITDYSSVMFDYAITGRPMFFYCYDLEAYRDELRGFYFDFIEEAPGPISRTSEELVRDIRNSFDKQIDAGIDSEIKAAETGIMTKEKDTESSVEEKYRKFREKYNAYDDGHAAEKIVTLLAIYSSKGDSHE